MSEEFVAVKIIDLPDSGSGCSCSATQRKPEFVAALMQKCDELKAALESRFPGRTSIEYIDLRQVPGAKETEAGRLLVSKQYPAPLVVIDGEPRFAGSIQVDRIVKEVESILTA